MKQHVGIACLVICLIFGASVPTLAVPNKVWILPGTPLKFADSAQAGVAAQLTLANLLTGTGRCSTRYDKNALVSPSGAMPWHWRWSGTLQLNGSGALGDVIQVFLAKSDNTTTQGGVGGTDSALSLNQTKNLTFVGQFVVDATAANPFLTASDYTEIRERYFSLCLYNATTVGLATSTTVNTMYMTPHSVEIQAEIPLDYEKRTAVPALA